MIQHLQLILQQLPVVLGLALAGCQGQQGSAGAGWVGIGGGLVQALLDSVQSPVAWLYRLSLLWLREYL